jgi:hypothetical protein
MTTWALIEGRLQLGCRKPVRGESRALSQWYRAQAGRSGRLGWVDERAVYFVLRRRATKPTTPKPASIRA